jgi:exosortase A
MSALPDALPASPRSGWLLPGTLTVGVLLILGGLFCPTLHSMVEIWDRSETFTHGYLIFPISAWLIWRQRDELAQVPLRTDLRGLLLLAAAGAGWLLADAGSVNVVAQYAFIVMLIAAVWTLLGWAFVWATFFPLLFLLFAVPVGEFLIPQLVQFTADFTVAALQLTGVPVYREGNQFSLASGDWSVIEECSGIRYLIASITLGALYAYLTYRSWNRRLLFVVAAIIVPIFANGGRAYMIVMIAHLSDMKLALGVDHYIYGWAFFGLVMMLLFWVGSFWREDDQPAPRQPERSAVPAGGNRARPLLPAAMAALAVAGLWPAYASWLGSRPLPAMPPLQVEAQAGWRPGAAFTSWEPHWAGADQKLRQSYAGAGGGVMLELNYYVTQRQDAELINSQNFMIERQHPVWSNVGEAFPAVTIGGETRQVRQARLKSNDGQRLLVWQWNLINHQPTVNDHMAKLVLALDRVRMQRDDGLSVLIATPYEETDIEAATATLARFAADMEPAIGRALDQVDGQ